MTKLKIGVLHPGNMGISVAASAQNSGHEVYWASEDRSLQSRQRAEKFALHDAITVADLCKTCSVIISICPPAAAERVAQQVAGHSFSGLYLDANAISPQRVQRIETVVTAKGASFVDGSIIGGPAWEPGRTWLYLSGEAAPRAADCFAGGSLETRVIGTETGKASSLKMCFAAYSKGTTALLCAILAAADQLNVRQELWDQWSRNGSTFANEAVDRTRRVTAKAWRFGAEMEEISDTFIGAGLPGGFHMAAADIYERLAQFKDAPAAPTLEEVLTALIEPVS